jgi:hypothetical protein
VAPSGNQAANGEDKVQPEAVEGRAGKQLPVIAMEKSAEAIVVPYGG